MQEWLESLENQEAKMDRYKMSMTIIYSKTGQLNSFQLTSDQLVQIQQI